MNEQDSVEDVNRKRNGKCHLKYFYFDKMLIHGTFSFAVSSFVRTRTAVSVLSGHLEDWEGNTEKELIMLKSEEGHGGVTVPPQ